MVMAIAAYPAIAFADPRDWAREGWKTEFSRSSVPFDEIISGGPPRDGIPSIDKPKFVKTSAVADIADREPVIQFGLGEHIRAYPLRVLTWHEIANDVVAGTPVAVTYCPLCNAAIVFDRRLDGRVLEFGTTGKLRHSDLVMYDRQTESWWQQFTGEAIVGSLTGEKLRLLPSRIVSFGSFRKAHPGGLVLVPNDPGFRDYGRNPYASYDTAATPFLFKGELPDDIPAMAHVVVVRTEREPIIVSLEKVRADGFERSGYRITYEAGVASALDDATIAKGRDVGTVRVTKDGRDVPHDITFAFVAHAFHPDIQIVAR
ncbi:DUF3179 domain-containing protein [Chelativorans alearense]|uniref:DUF3179 domain-containing protein n=1 Tax=Chelativorans alearense TaxID=2681495 RepID=UPI001969B696|nr:DUF3179 domain-containing protein [Chelativorans alearense]